MGKSTFKKISLAAFACTALIATAQQGGFGPTSSAKKALAEPFVGVTKDGSPQKGLFKIEQTGVSTLAVVKAADRFLDSLGENQREQVSFPVDDIEWRDWANTHRYKRQGVSLKAMTDEQKECAYQLLQASLSAKGYKTSRDIMRLNHHLAELVSNFDEYGEHLYWFTLMGTPSSTEPWGWQIDGHHLIINYFVHGDQIVMTPTFMGSEPVHAHSGKYSGTEILQQEQDLGLELMQELPKKQQEVAILGQKNGHSSAQAELFKDNVVIPEEGLKVSEMSPESREKLLKLIEAYVGNIDDGHAKVKMEEVRSHLDSTYFAWKGGYEDDSVFYYRVYSPVLLIEFDHQGPIALEGTRGVPSRRHIHTVVRTPNGNDYGKDLLRQHYESHRHSFEYGTSK